MKFHIFLLFLFYCQSLAKTNSKSSVIDDVYDVKELKKIFRTKNNVLVLYVSGSKETQSTRKIFREAAEVIKGQGSMILIDCSHSEAKKLCKKMKVTPTPVALKHYKDGDLHKDYDRQVTVTSIANFMRDPGGDLPWEEDPIGADVYHIQDAAALGKYLKRETKPVMVMFYAPWCGYCKQLKPDYSEAATELKSSGHVLAAIDVNRPENSVIRKQYNITGFPTLLYYENAQFKYVYEGDNNKAAIVSFMKNPTAPPLVKPKEADWASETTSEIVHLTSTSFEPALIDEKSVLVMFYAPWCGHCKRMKPEYEKAALVMKEKKISGVLAALDATKEAEIGSRFNVKGYPTVKYFVNGEFKFDVNVRDADKIVEFMKNPSEPPPPPPPEKPWKEEPSHVVHLDDSNFKTFLKKKKHVLVMFYAPWCGHCKKAKPEFVTAADHFKDDIRVELAAIDCTEFPSTCSSYSVRGYPTIIYFNYLKSTKDYQGGRTSSDFIKFLSDPDAPEEVPAAQPFGTYPGSEHVLILSDSDFDVKIKAYKRALVMFYAPWCGHCTKMKADLSLAAERLAKENSGAVIAAVDATIHRKLSKQFDIAGFPTIKYFENGVFKTEYNGKRISEDLYNYVKSGGTTKDEL